MKNVNRRQVYVCLVATLTSLFSGLNSGFSSEYIQQLKSQKNVSNSDISWIGSSGGILTVFGCLAGGFLMDTLGRKFLFFCTYSVHFVGWMIIAESQYFHIGRVVISLAVGLGYGCLVYIAEVVPSDYRGAFISMGGVFEIGGSLCVFLIEYYITTTETALLLSIFALALFLNVFVIPESPYWHMMKNRREDAAKSLIWLRMGNEVSVECDIDDIEKSLAASKKDKTFVQVVFNVKWWKVFLFYAVYVVLIQLTGFDLFIAYAVQLYETFNETGVDDKLMSILFVTAALAGAIITTFIVDKFKRTSLVKWANLLNLLLFSIATISETFLLHSTLATSLSLLCSIFYSTTSAVVAYALPWTIISESLPTELRATVFTALISEYSIVWILSTTFFPMVLSPKSANYIFLTFALIALLNYLFVNYFLKDTRGAVLPGSRNA